MELINYTSYYNSPLGKIELIYDNTCLLELHFIDKLPAKRAVEKKTPLLKDINRWLDTYFSKKIPDFNIPLKLNGTPFQKEVCEILASIPYGKTLSYGEIANNIAQKRGILKMSSQAVGSAIGKNKILIIVPCHRVIASDGTIGGYSQGMKRKIELLKLENSFKQT